MPTTYPVAAWRRPANIGLLLMVSVPIELICVVASVLIASKGFNAPPEVIRSTIFPLGMFLGAGLVGLIAWADHRLHPAGTFKLDGSRVHFDGWAARTYDFDVAEIQKTLVVHTGTPQEVLVVYRSSGPRLYLHAARVRVPLTEVMTALVNAVPSADQKSSIASASTAEAKRQSLIGKVILYAAGAAFLLNLLRLILS